MSLRALELDTLHLSNPGHHLKLSVISAADIRIPPCISNLEDAALVKALASKNLWVSRGVACHIDIQVHFNGKPLDGEGCLNFLESMGYSIRDAQLWSLLSLSASLDVWKNDGRRDSSPDLSINIKHGVEIPTPQTRHRAWILDTFDIRAPDSILCAAFECLQIRLDFFEIRKKAKRARIGKPVVTEFDIEEEMLLDVPLGFNTYQTTDELAHVVESMGGLSSMIEQCFQPSLGFGKDPDLLQQHHSHLFDQDQITAAPILVQDIIKPDRENGKGKNRRYPQAKIDILNAWFQAHANRPYPSKDEKLELARKTGLSRSQVDNWFHDRRRKVPKGPGQEDEMLLAQEGNDENARGADDEGEDGILLPQGMGNTPSLTSQSSIASSVLLPGEEERSLKRPSPPNETILPDRLPACDLGKAAIQVLISGHIGRSLRGLGGIQVEKPPPSLSLSSLVPSTFCPEFKESIAQNAHFLPTISHAISVSWPRNIQSPTLREKLSRLANSSTSSLTHANRIEDGEAGITARLASVIQSRLWGMMQRKLFDPSAGAKIWGKSTLRGDLDEEDEFPELLGTLEGRDDVEDPVAGKLDDFDEDEFEDLLSTDDDDLLEYMEERERLSVERDTEEMLFRSGWDEDQTDDGDVCLLDGDAGVDPMLL
ncbi:hypothetical protein N431DRAFT_541237 [Stipitochalara longipes BDJ]|nr:hypothetical protein N431DRAFT_541237 [Stipitochalara longipes BDJ]